MAELGLGLPNSAFVADDWPRIRALGLCSYLDLHWYSDRWTWLKAQQPDCELWVRIDERGPLGDPEADARDTDAKAWAHLEVDHWLRRNEPQHESPGVTPDQWRQWQTAYGRALQRLGTPGQHWAAAVSPNVDAEAWLAANAVSAREGRMNGMTAHVYGAPGEVDRALAQVRQRWPGRLAWTEWNFGAGRLWNLDEYARSLPTVMSQAAQYGAEVMHVFTWHWRNAGIALPTSVDVKGSPMEAAIRQWSAGQTPNGGTMTLAEQYPNEYQAWAAAGGVENNFRAHLIGIGSLKPTADDLKVLAGNAKAATTQVENALAVYPF